MEYQNSQGPLYHYHHSLRCPLEHSRVTRFCRILGYTLCISGSVFSKHNFASATPKWNRLGGVSAHTEGPHSCYLPNAPSSAIFSLLSSVYSASTTSQLSLSEHPCITGISTATGIKRCSKVVCKVSCLEPIEVSSSSHCCYQLSFNLSPFSSSSELQRNLQALK